MKTAQKVRKQAIGENMLYALIWALVYLIPIMNSKLMSEDHVNFVNVTIAWLKITPFFVLFLVNNAGLLPRLFMRKRVFSYAVTSLLLMGITFGLITLFEQWNMSQDNAEALMIKARHASLTDLEWYWNIPLCIFMFLSNMGLKLLYQSMQDDEDMERLRSENMKAEMESLKYQINPHFFMNTLNNIHALVDIDPEAAKQSIIQLSHMMRYVVYDSGGNSIPLSQDIEFIKNYIELMRIRYSDDVEISFRHPNSLSRDIKIVPLVLVVFVENAFKHGVSYNTKSFIHINLSVVGDHIYARFSNSVIDRKDDTEKGGVGLENVRRRLDLIYGSEYSIQISDSDPEQYSVTLSMPILRK